MGRVEAIAAAPDYSPQSAQDNSIGAKNGLPANNSEFLKYLLIDKSPLDKMFEVADAAIDIQIAMSEWLELRASPIYRGEGVPRGEGVVVIAGGFMTTKFNYQATAHAFKEMGYTPVVYIPKPGINILPVEQGEQEFMDFLNSFEGQVYLITHSKGGLQAYAAYATRREEFTSKVQHWAQVAAPNPKWVNFVVGTPYFGTQLIYGGDDFKFRKEILENVDIENIDGIPLTVIGNPRDPIFRGTMIGKPDQQFLVNSSHSGALYDPKNLALIAHRFAESVAILAEAA